MREKYPILVTRFGGVLLAGFVLSLLLPRFCAADTDEAEAALLEAVRQGDIDDARRLMEQGADVNHKVARCDFPLHEAVKIGNVEMVRLLLKSGASTDQRDIYKGWTALHYAANSGNAEIVDALIGAGAEVEARGALRHRAKYRYEGDGDPVVCVAQGAEVVKRLLNAKASPQELDSAGGELLHKTRDPAVMRILLEHGVNPDGREWSWSTPLYAAAETGDLEKAQLLIDAGANVNGRGWYANPLDEAIDQNHKEIVELLRRHGAKDRAAIRKELDAAERATVAELKQAGARIEEVAGMWQPEFYIQFGGSQDAADARKRISSFRHVIGLEISGVVDGTIISQVLQHRHLTWLSLYDATAHVDQLLPLAKLNKLDYLALPKSIDAKQLGELRKAMPKGVIWIPESREVFEAVQRLTWHDRGSRFEVEDRDGVSVIVGFTLQRKFHPDDNLAIFSGIRRLRFRSNELGPEGLLPLKRLTKLEELSLECAAITDDDLGQLAGLSELQILDLSKTSVTDAGLEHLSDLKQLRILRVRDWDGHAKVSYEGVLRLFVNLQKRPLADAFAALEAQLERSHSGDLLSVSPTTARAYGKDSSGFVFRFDDRAIRYLEHAPVLETLNLQNCSGITGEGLAVLATLLKLRSLNLDGLDAVTAADLSQIAASTHLEELECGALSDAALAELKKFGDLRKLKVSIKGGDEALAILSGLTKLESLDLNRSNRLTDAGLVHLRDLKNLKRLDTGNSRISFEAKVELFSKHLGHDPKTAVTLVARERDLENGQVVNLTLSADYERISSLPELTSLRQLALNGPVIDDRCLSLLKRLNALETLEIRGSISNEGLKHLAQLPRLRRLILDNMTSDQYASLSNLELLTRVEELQVRTGFDDSGLVHIGRMKNLRKIWLGSTKITGEGLAHLADLNRLESLDLSGCGVGDVGLRYILNLSQLSELGLWFSGGFQTESLFLLERLPRLQKLYLDDSHNIRTKYYGVFPDVEISEEGT